MLLFVWGTHVLPVFLTSVGIEETAHMPSLIPYRATATLGMQVIEGNNPFYEVEKIRQDRINILLPEVMKDKGIDLWLTFTRENATDPILKVLGIDHIVARGAFIFALTG